jgi:O-Antigen ligase
MTSSTRSSARPLELARESLPVLPAVALVLFWALSALFNGAYFPASWYPAAIVIVIICPIQLAAGYRLPVGGTRIALGLFGGLVAWTFLTILWAEAGGHALEASDKLLLAFASAFVFALTPWNERRTVAVLGLFALGYTTGSVVTLVGAAIAHDPGGNFIEQRFSEPLGYAGAAAAFAAIAVWPALALSALRTLPTWARAVFFAFAVVQADIAFMPQARGAVVGLVVGAVVFFCFASPRSWALVRILLGAAIVAVTLGPILDVYTATNNGGSVTAALDDSVTAILIAALLAAAVGLGLAWLEARSPTVPGSDTAQRLALPGLGIAVVVLVVIGLVFNGRISNYVSDHWDTFKSGSISEEDVSHLTSLNDPERYEYWRVAVDLTGDNPVGGVGAGNYQDRYTVDRKTEKASRYAHDIWFETMSETGIIGLLLLIGGIGAVVFTVAAARPRAPDPERLLCAGALAATFYVLTHASLDWVDQYPAILGPALAFLLLAARLVTPVPRGRSRHQGGALLISMVIAGLALVALVPTYLSVRYVERAESAWPADPAAAYKDLDRAAWLDPLSSQAELTRGQIAIARAEYQRARQAFAAAISREDSWYPHYQLATIASGEKRHREALAQMRAAYRLDSADDLMHFSLQRLNRGEPLNPAIAQELIARESARRFYHLHQPNR